MKQAKNINGMSRYFIGGWILIIMLGIFTFSDFSQGYSRDSNYRNVSIDTTVNITNSPPTVLDVLIDNGVAITLTAGGTKQIICNATIRDYNGAATLIEVNATFWDNNTNISSDPDNNNSHYTNGSCFAVSVSGNFANYTCSFDLYYYAQNSTNWYCNVTATDDYAFQDSLTNVTTVNALLALNVTTPLDYGDLAVGDTSTNHTANITNYGNVPINVSIYGYGNVTNDYQALICDEGNISIAHEKWSINDTAEYSSKISLSGNNSAPQELGLTISKQTIPSSLITNVTYWQLFVPEASIFGTCNGTIVFEAELP